MALRISATSAAQALSSILNRVHDRRDEFVVERRGKPVCRITPVGPARCTGADLAKVLDTLPCLDAAYPGTVERATRAQPKAPRPRRSRS